jgi:aldose 1-epimerase
VTSAAADDRSAQVTSRPPSGRQYAIAHGTHRAVVTQVGATLRELSLGGSSIIDGFDVDHRATDGRGQVLAPWPNRLAAGRYVFGGHACQAPLNEPARQNAIHGLVRWLDWAPVAQDDSAVTLSCLLRPQPGYEWQLDLEVEYRLEPVGLTVTTRILNLGVSDAPFGMGFHPYLQLGRPVDGLGLQLPARSHLPPADPDSPPTALPVAGTTLEFSTLRTIGDAQLDTCFTDLDRGVNGRAVAVLSDPDSDRRVHLWVDESFPYLMVYTGDDVGVPQRRRQSIAVEPMTCPPNAFRSGTGLLRLPPARQWQASWGITLAPPG